MVKKALPIDTVVRVNKIFLRKGWMLLEDTAGEYDNIYINYCEMLASLSQEEQSLILNLTNDYQYFPHSKYSSLLVQALSTMPAGFLQAYSGIYVVPAKKPADSNKVKSDSAVMYLFKHLIQQKYNLENIHAFDRLEFLESTAESRDNSLIIFIDDFVGTGDTVIAALQQYLTSYASKDDDVCVLGLVVQEHGASAIRDFGIEVYNAVVIKKGISESSCIADKAEAYSIMDKIESKIKVKKDYRRGYKGSEALVSLIRTPNNTFPVFWKEPYGSSVSWKPPFYR